MLRGARQPGSGRLDSALAGDLSLINAIDDVEEAHGIRVLRSRTRSIRKKRLAWRINLVGIVNVLSMSELVKSGSVRYARRGIGRAGDHRQDDERSRRRDHNKQIRKLLYESTVMSLTYQAIGLDPAVPASTSARASSFLTSLQIDSACPTIWTRCARSA